MSNNFLIVLFKNKKKQKIIKRYEKEKNASDEFSKIIKNNKVYFEKQIENATDVVFELGLLTNKTKVQKTLFLKDDIGRNYTANLDNSDYVFLDIKKYYIEEKIYDLQTKNKITFNSFVKNYLSDKELKSIFTINNKLCVQKDETVYVFSLKSVSDCYRFFDSLQQYYIDENRTDAIFVKDISIAQRKWLYKLLTEKGFDISYLYRTKTTFSKR